MSGSESPATRPRVLVVDDNCDAAEAVAFYLSLLGANTQAADSGDAAVNAVKEFKPDLIVLDLGMEGMNGYETARHIRALPEGSAATLVALTGWGRPEDVKRSMASGFDYHFVKPNGIEELKELLAGL